MTRPPPPEHHIILSTVLTVAPPTSSQKLTESTGLDPAEIVLEARTEWPVWKWETMQTGRLNTVTQWPDDFTDSIGL